MPVRTWKRPSFYVVQHKEGDISTPLGDLAMSQGFVPWDVFLIGTVLGFIIGVTITTYELKQENDNLKKALFSAQAEVTRLSIPQPQPCHMQRCSK